MSTMFVQGKQNPTCLVPFSIFESPIHTRKWARRHLLLGFHINFNVAEMIKCLHCGFNVVCCVLMNNYCTRAIYFPCLHSNINKTNCKCKVTEVLFRGA